VRRFKFRLEAVLKHRAVMEELAQQAFAKVQLELKAADQALAELRTAYAEAIGGRAAGVDLEDVSRRERYIDALLMRIGEQERVIEGINARLNDARMALVSARQAREAIERVKEQDYRQYLQDVTHEEQRLIDEMATARHGRVS
jgi:flagellar protein FliJ